MSGPSSGKEAGTNTDSSLGRNGAGNFHKNVSPAAQKQEDLRFLGQSARVLFTESSTQPANIQEELRLIYEAIRKLEGKLEGSIHELKTSVQELKTSIDEVRVETRQNFIQTKNFNSQTLDLLPARSGQPPNSPGGGSFPKTYADIQAKTLKQLRSWLQAYGQDMPAHLKHNEAVTQLAGFLGATPRL